VVAVALARPTETPASGYTDLTHIQSFDGAAGWLNSPPLTPAQLRGKVVLVDFWEYTCVNCLKALPYERAWFARYRPLDFVIVGVHTPEFKFSSEATNVAAAVKRLGITWPVALDSSMTIWNRYRNEFWPHEFLIDRKGRIVYDHIGEGDYPDTERRIQEVLGADHPHVKFPTVMGYLPQDSYARPGAVCYPHTPETYVGDWRGDGALASPPGYAAAGRVVTYADVDPHDDGRVYLQGPWKVAASRQAMINAGNGRASATTTNGRDYISLFYHAIEVVAVLRPENGHPVKTYVDQDGKAVARQDAGKDLRFDGIGSYIVVDAARAYDVIMNRHFGRHELRLLPVDNGVGVYTFDFESCEIGSDK
jgi:thiol-disulfide isomerase/thioredoxin